MKCAFKRGLATSQNVGYLFYFFCVWRVAEKKKTSALLNRVWLEIKKYTTTIEGLKSLRKARFFPPKDLVYF